ncbi:MAG TPA: hypothetical protein VIE13_13160 [Terriglobales bacterium]|jgi:ribosomal protein S2
MSNLTKAIQDLEDQKRRIDAALKILRDLNHNGHVSTTGTRNISTEGRRRIAEAQRRRWAKARAAAAAKK